MNDMKDLVRDYRPEVKDLLQNLRARGIAILRGSNGGDPSEDFFASGDKPLPESEFIEECCGADECTLIVKAPDAAGTKWLWLVFGNSPGELVADYLTGSDLVEAAVDQTSAKWELLEQPMVERGAS